MLMDVKEYEKHLQTENLARLLDPAKQVVERGLVNGGAKMCTYGGMKGFKSP